MGVLDFDFNLAFSGGLSLTSSLSDLISSLLSSSSDLELTSESESVLELSSSVSLLECSPEKLKTY